MKQILVAGCGLLATACASIEPEGPSAVAIVRPASGSQVQGEAKFTQVGNRVRITANISGLSPGAHGFHIHEKGDCSAADAMSTGGHFNPKGNKHGAPATPDRHAGDLGNLNADEYGKATLALMVDGISVGKGPDGISGRGLIVHANADDLKTDPTGNAGGRVGCAVIN
jgi:Cu-Zn family superoxide dismutase